MTEAEWLACGDPEQLLEFLQRDASRHLLEIRWGKRSVRKRPLFTVDRRLRLFTVACFARCSQWLVDERSRRAIAVVEQIADGLLRFTAIMEEEPPARAAIAEIAAREDFGPIHAVAVAASEVLSFDGARAAINTSYRIGEVQELLGGSSSEEWLRQACILRDLFGPVPFREVPRPQEWLTPTVLSLAQAIYADRAFNHLPILADALEDAGCTDRDVLDHCRGSGPHVRGCWAVDLVLGKE